MKKLTHACKKSYITIISSISKKKQKNQKKKRSKKPKTKTQKTKTSYTKDM